MSGLRHARWLAALGAAGLLAAGGGWLLQPAPAEFDTVPVARADIEEAVLASGTLTPVRQVSVGAQVSGQLKSLKVALGERVVKGQLLAEIDPILQQNELLQAEAALQNLKAQRAAQVALRRQHELALRREQALRADDANAVADLELAQSQADTTRANIAALDAQLRQGRAAVETARANLAYTRISAPMDGQVIAIVTQEGQTVVSAQAAPTILVLAELDQMLVKARISEADVVRVRAGQEAWFTILGAAQRKFHARLKSVEPAPPVEQASQDGMPGQSGAAGAVYYNGLLEVANEDGILRPSMTAQVSIVLGRASQALVVPAAAVRGPDRAGRYSVDVLSGGNGAGVESRQIETGVSDHVSVQVLGGLAEGERVVVGARSPDDGGQP
ncbi:efflux RND transporter periplasmic adaptor subunit [Cupriavidus agavae]|uniref:Macrolide-specific efflux system membrane fusion protein n=1 Tax=Cupriavidus agavae TaxID=1001822 RepID=A0A4Q7S7V9_9BURK|nr:efflux RND transporter periplasmic adaptor subunit [Cupriavidus agavae]RZT42383.1 macrolide-specific efflux system membrane fusion protein [Cupriavidus agavae]